VILADTSVWADHLRAGDVALQRLLDANELFMHPFVIGEISLGYIRKRDTVLRELKRIPRAPTVRDQEVWHLIENRGLIAAGIGYVDAHILASVRIIPGLGLWTRDKRLHSVAEKLGLAVTPKASP
jgi:predicted nucleic acid-binding protein